MTAKTTLKRLFSVEWTTGFPTKDLSRKSPTFFLWGSECFLEFKLAYRYYLYLCKIDQEEKRFDPPIQVKTFIEDSLEPTAFQRTKISSPGDSIWQRDKDIMLKEYDILGKSKWTVTCVFHPTDTNIQKTYLSTKTPSFGLQSLSTDFAIFLKDETFSDVKLKCADRIFSAHRSILAARSEVFAAMFRNEMAEREAGSVDIKDVEPEVLEMLLQYVYSGVKTDLCDDTARRLYEVADKYAIHGVRGACSDWMVENQTTENCLELLLLADKHSDENFKDAVSCFTAKKFRLLDSENWSLFKEKYPALAVKIYEKCWEDLPSDQP